jgi:hypothetical protein
MRLLLVRILPSPDPSSDSEPSARREVDSKAYQARLNHASGGPLERLVGFSAKNRFYRATHAAGASPV